MKRIKIYKRFTSFVLILAMLLSLTACGESTTNTALSDPNEEIVTENIEVENIETEDIATETVLTEFITSEIYLEEIVLAEDKITEILLQEGTIEEVLLCKTIYVPQDSIDEFSEHSQTKELFGDGIELSSVLKKVAVGTGVIVTLVVLKKVGLSESVASVVTAAADESLTFAENGAAIGSLFGGLTGTTDEIDESGRTSAIIGFATATAGLILSIVSLLGEIPSGGTSSVSLAAGVKLVIAGVSVLAATGGTAYAGYQAVKTFQSTDGTDIDWQNIDWDQVGVSAAEKAINNGADGYMWGAIIGTVYGGADGYEFYHKYNTPYTQYNARLQQTPKEGNGGKWTGERGESDFILDEPIVLEDGTKITTATYKNAVPDFSPYAKAEVNITSMTNNRSKNFRQADKALAEYWTKTKYQGKSWTKSDVEQYRSDNNLTWHEMSNMGSMQLVPHDVNQEFTHFGGVAEYNAMIGTEGEGDYD